MYYKSITSGEHICMHMFHFESVRVPKTECLFIDNQLLVQTDPKIRVRLVFPRTFVNEVPIVLGNCLIV
jgi:hypothetical protein